MKIHGGFSVGMDKTKKGKERKKKAMKQVSKPVMQSNIQKQTQSGIVVLKTGAKGIRYNSFGQDGCGY